MNKLFTAFILTSFLFFNTINLFGNGKNIPTTDYGLIFKENKGQVQDQNNNPRPDILFSGESKGLIYHLKNDGLHYQIVKVESGKNVDNSLINKQYSKNKIQGKQELVPDKISLYRVDVDWKNVNKKAKIEVGEELPGYENFYNVPNGSKPALGVRSYKFVVYENIYEGIDLKFYEGNGELEYDFIVQPGADFRQIQMEYKGAEISINKTNELVLKTPFGEIREGELKVYQDNKQIVANWNVSNDVVTFEIPKYDPTKPIRIDPPTRLWGTYYGGSSYEYGRGVAVDNYGNSYIVGSTQSTFNIATSGAFKTTLSGTSLDVYFAKFKPNGVRVWGTYYGGTADDYGAGIALDIYDNILVTGHTNSASGIATSGAHQTTKGGTSDNDAFLLKFTSDGYRLWATYYGGTDHDGGYAIATDYYENIYLVGSAGSTTGIATSGVHQSTIGGNMDAFVAKFNGDGVRQWGTYYGGSDMEEAFSVAYCSSDYIYVAGFTSSNTNISSTGAHQTSRGGDDDGFIVKFTPNGARVWGTYYGGSDNDRCASVAVDPYTNVYAVGKTSSTNNIAISGTYQPNLAGNDDGFLVKFYSNGQRVWGTYYGGSDDDYLTGITIDYENNLYMCGSTYSNDGIATYNAYQQYKNDYNDGFLVKMTHDGGRIWGTYYGGMDDDEARGVAVDSPGNLFFVGYTWSADEISSEGSHQDSWSGSSDAFLVKFGKCENELMAWSNSPVCECEEFQLFASDGWVSYTWFGSDFTSNEQNPKLTLCSTGVYTYYVVAVDGNGCETSAEVEVELVSGPMIVAYYDYPVCVGQDLALHVDVNIPTIIESRSKKNKNNILGESFTFKWTGPNDFTSDEQHPIIENTTLDNQGTYYVEVTDNETGCKSTSYIDVFFETGVDMEPGSNSPICEGETLYLYADLEAEIVKTNDKDMKNKLQFGEYFEWTGPNDFYSTERDPVIENATTAMSGTYYLTVTPYMGCESTYEIQVLVGEIPSVTIITKSGNNSEYLCEGDDYQFDVTSDADYYYWSGPNDFSSTEKNPILINLSYENSGEYILTAIKEDGCSATEYVDIFVNNLPEAYPGSNSPLCEGNDLYLFAFYNYGMVENNSKKDNNKLQNGYQYNWTGPNDFSSTEMDPIIENANLSNAGRYILTVKNYSGCENTYYVDVHIYSSPTFDLSSNSPICSGGTLSLEATAEEEYYYYWTGPNGFSAEGPNPTITGATPSYSGTYYCQANNSGCSTTKSIDVVINPKPTVNASSNSPQCQGSTLNLFAQGPAGSTYSWSGPNGFTSNLQNPVINNAQPTHSGNYVVICTNSGCTATASVSVTINAKPVVSASYNSPVYLGETIQFNATAGFASYQWSGPNGFSSNLRNPSIENADASHSGTYTLIVTNSSGCSTTITLDVQVVDEEFEIDLFITPEIQKVAYGTSLHPAFTSSVTVSKYSYKWYFDEDDTPENGNETLIATTIHLGLTSIKFTDEGYYYLKVSYGSESVISNVAQLLVTAQQPKNNAVINRSQKTITVEWEDPEEGQGDGVLVVVSKQTDYNNSILPIDGKTYSANSAFGDNSKITGTKHYVVYNGNGNQVQVTNLTRGTYYRFRWFAYRNGGLISPTYNTNQSQNNPRSINTPYKEPDDNAYRISTSMALSTIYPNPVTDGNIQFDLMLEDNSKIEVKVLTSIGENVYTNTFELPEGDNTIVFDLFKKHRLASGTYLLQVSNGSEILQQSFIIIY